MELNAGEGACEGAAGVEVHVYHLQPTAGGLPTCMIPVTDCKLQGRRVVIYQMSYIESKACRDARGK